MPTTKFKISEQVIRILKGSDNPNASKVRIQEVIELIGQVVNKLLKAEHYVQMNEGDVVPNAYILATYENVPVTQYKINYSKATLPAVPVRLPKNMGVFHISKTDDPFNPFIPVPSGIFTMVSAEPLISTVLGQIAYEVYGNLIVFTTDLTTAVPAITEVMIRLVVMDVSQLTDYDPLPIPADMEVDVIAGVLKLLGIQAEPENKVDVATETKTH